jgi:hypothetical protein
MRPGERRESGEQDLFRSRLDQIIDMEAWANTRHPNTCEPDLERFAQEGR